MMTEDPQFKVFVLGGLLNSRTFSIRGALTCNMLGEMYANVFFLSPRGVDEKGVIFLTDEEETATRRLMMERSDKTILLCSTKKLGQRGPFRMCGLSEVDGIVCECETEQKWQELFAKTGLQVY